MNITSSAVRNNTAKHRYELDVDGTIAFADYRMMSGTVIITHVETPVELRGRGIAATLTEGALHLIRADGLKVIGQCSYARTYLDRHPEFSDLRA